MHKGQRAYIRFSAFNQRTTPQLEGVVSYVSADLNHDRQKNSNAADLLHGPRDASAE